MTKKTARVLGSAFVMTMAMGLLNQAAASTAGNPPAATVNPYLCEGEFYSSKINGRYSTVGYDYKPSASNKNSAHIASYSSNINYGLGESVLYAINVLRPYYGAQLQIRYADAVPGNVIQVYLDNVLRGTITTQNTGGWGAFVWHSTLIPLGNIGTGTHVVSFLVTKGGSYGMNLDMFKITGQ
jgi:hypothetical protein